MTWRKGCLCGCLIEEECRYYEPPAQRVEHVHHVFVHREPDVPALGAWADEVEIVRGEIES